MMMDSEDLPYGFDLVSATIYMYMSPTSAGKGSLNLTAVTLPHHVRSHANPGTFDLRRGATWWQALILVVD